MASKPQFADLCLEEQIFTSSQLSLFQTGRQNKGLRHMKGQGWGRKKRMSWAAALTGTKE